MKRCAAVLILLGLAACGSEQQRQEPGPPPLLVPGDPEAALAWVEEVQDEDAAVRARLDAWPGKGAFADAEETQIAWTWRLQLALRDGDVERAGDLRELLVHRFEGRGQYPQGRALSPDAVRLAVFEEALLQARRRIEHAPPDLRGARSAVEVAGHMLMEDESDDRKQLAGTQAWVERTHAADIVRAVGGEAPIRDRAQATLVVLADDFTLGDRIFFEVLKQWRDAHAEARFDRVLIPLLRGQVRMGLRLVPAESREEEIASIDARCSGAGLARQKPVPVERLAALGLREGEAALVLADAKGRIVARLSGRNPDPRALEPALQRLLSR